MDYSPTFKTHVTNNPARFQETFEKHVFWLSGSPRGNVFIGFSQRRVRIMRFANRHRLNAEDDLAAHELMRKRGSSNCPYWLAEMRVAELMDTLKVKLEGNQLVPTSSIRLLFFAEPRTSTLPWDRGKQHPTFVMIEESAGKRIHGNGNPTIWDF
jgi:hypothetical protein